MFHFHTCPGGNSDINNFIPLVEKYGKRCKIYLVHFGGGVSGHIKLVPKFLQWVRDGYKVYTDTSWAVGFGARWLLTEIEKQGVGGDRVFFGSDEPWSDFDSEYWKLNGVRDISQELKDRVFWQQLRRGLSAPMLEPARRPPAARRAAVARRARGRRDGRAAARPARRRRAVGRAVPVGARAAADRARRTRASSPRRRTRCAWRAGARRCTATTSWSGR